MGVAGVEQKHHPSVLGTPWLALGVIVLQMYALSLAHDDLLGKKSHCVCSTEEKLASRGLATLTAQV